MDKLEKFITENREKFDDRNPGDELWNGISARLDGNKPGKRSISQYMWKAASFVLLAMVIGLLTERIYHRDRSQNSLQGNERLTELNQVEDYYTSLIAQKRNEIQVYLSENPDFRQSFSHDITQLDSMYTSLKSELSNSYSDKIVDAMIVNLQLRIRILNQQLDILKSIQKTKEHDKAKT